MLLVANCGLSLAFGQPLVQAIVPPAGRPVELREVDATPCLPRNSREAPRPAVPAGELRRARAAVPDAEDRGVGPCAPAEFAALSGPALAEAIASATDSCLSALWNYSSDVEAVCAATNVLAVAAALGQEAPGLPTSADRIRRLLLFCQIAFYHEFYEPGLDYDESTESAVRAAVAQIADAAPFRDESDAVRRLRFQWAISVDSTNATHLAIGAVQWMLDRYHAQPALSLDYYERYTVWSLCFTISRQIPNWAGGNPPQSPWYNLLSPAFVDSLASLALDQGYVPEAEYVVNAAVWALGALSRLNPATRAAGHARAGEAFETHFQYSGPWVWSATVLESYYGGTLPDGSAIDFAALRAGTRAHALPNHISFDLDRMRFETAVSAATVMELYDALQEVEGQFFRQCSHLSPVANDRNEVIRLLVYGSRAEYERFQSFLFGLSTNNGGIYIEQTGTLYTYQRQPSESIYTLEELLRHEYTHYLDGRYNITGEFGDPGSLYDGERLTWYQEGLAECMVGGTRTSGVLPRRKLVQLVAHDGTNRMSVADIVASTYDSGFRFYQYAGLFLNYLRAARPDIIVRIHDAISANSASAVDALWAELSSDVALQLGYDAYLQAQIAALPDGLFAEDVPTTPTPAYLPTGNIEAIFQSISNTAGWLGAMHAHDGRYRYSAQVYVGLSGPAENWPVVARQLLDGTVSYWLHDLAPQGPNFTSTVGWYGDIELYPEWSLASGTVAIEGPYRVSSSDLSPPAAPTNLRALVTNGRVELGWDASPSVDLAGYRVEWSLLVDGPYSPVSLLLEPSTTFSVDLPPAGARFVVQAIDAAGNVSQPSNQVTYAGPLLVVNGYFDSSTYYVNAYRAALESDGYAYSYWSVPDQGPPGAAVLGDFADGLVIWSVGYHWGIVPEQLDAPQRAALVGYLQQGGRLLLSGAFTALNLGSTPLFADYLRVQPVGVSANLGRLNGISGTIGEGVDVDFSFIGYTSEIDPIAPATAAWRFDPNSGPGQLWSSGSAVATVDAGYRTVFFAFPFGDVVGEDREPLLARVLDWMIDAPLPCDLDGNGVVGAPDASLLMGCMRGPGVAPQCAPEAIASGDFDLDGDCDLADLAGFQRAFANE